MRTQRAFMGHLLYTLLINLATGNKKGLGSWPTSICLCANFPSLWVSLYGTIVVPGGALLELPFSEALYVVVFLEVFLWLIVRLINQTSGGFLSFWSMLMKRIIWDLLHKYWTGGKYNSWIGMISLGVNSSKFGSRATRLSNLEDYRPPFLGLRIYYPY